MQTFDAIIERANAADAAKPGYGMLGDLIGYLEAALNGGFKYCEVDHFCDEMNDDFVEVLEAAGLSYDDGDEMPEDVAEASGRNEIGEASGLIEEGYNAERGDSNDTDYVKLASLLATAIDKRTKWIATL